MTAWATETDLPARYQQQVTQDDLDLAQMILEPFVGTTSASTDRGVVSTRNLRYLRQAVVFQAIWLTAHPDLLTNMDVSTAGQDGLTAQFSSVNSQLVAPMAQRCINRLSWKCAPLRVRRARTTQFAFLLGNRDSPTRSW